MTSLTFPFQGYICCNSDTRGSRVALKTRVLLNQRNISQLNQRNIRRDKESFIAAEIKIFFFKDACLCHENLHF